jgi:hypothetical protein
MIERARVRFLLAAFRRYPWLQFRVKHFDPHRLVTAGHTLTLLFTLR